MTQPINKRLREEWRKFCKTMWGKNISAVGEIESYHWWLARIDELKAKLIAGVGEEEECMHNETSCGITISCRDVAIKNKSRQHFLDNINKVFSK